MSNETKLKPCPFCGGAAEFSYHNGGWPDRCYSVQCANWRCPGKTSAGTTEVAAASWNTRHPVETADALIFERERLRKALAAIGTLPEGYCFCPGSRDARRPEHLHTGECQDARAALASCHIEKEPTR